MLTNLRNKVIPLFAQSQALFPFLALKHPGPYSHTLSTLNTLNQRYSFSTYFNDLDKTDVQTYSERKFQNKKYRGLIALWKKPLEQKKRRQ